jgi:hypothetical protein
MSFEDGQLAALFATSEFKARALALTLVLSLVAEKSIIAIKPEPVRQILRSKPEPRSWGEYDSSLGEYSIVAQPEELEELLDATELLSLAEEVVHLLPDDADVAVLTEMARTVAT